MKFAGNAGASKKELASFQKTTGYKLPEDYVEFLRRYNGGEGFIGSEYLILWKLGELQDFNRDYEVREYLPDVLLFGSTGGGDAYGFQTKSEPWEVIRVPFVGMSPEDSEKVAGSFSELLKLLEQS